MFGFNGFFQGIKKGTTLILLVKVFSTFGLGFASYFFKTHGVELYKIILIWAISPLASLPVVRFINNWNVKKYLRLGLLTYTGMALSLLFFNKYSFLLYGISDGLKLGLFWVSVNYIFFLKSTNDRYAKDSSIYFILGPLLGIVLPPIGALIIHDLGFRALFFITGLLSFLPLLYVRGSDFEYITQVRWHEADRRFSGLRLITFYDAVLEFFQGQFLTIYALLFLKTEYQVGGLLSYLALISLVVSFFLAGISDKRQKRVEILYPLLIAMSFLIFIIPAIKSLSIFIAIVGLYAILDNLSLPIRFAVPMDVVKLDIGFWRASEFYGNLGRTIVFAVAAVLLYVGNYWLAFLIFALMTLSFPFIISRKINELRVSSRLAEELGSEVGR